ncbi:MAG TPA: carbon-nitrogen hydrolase family protein [Streptosporangiaceae bacterium]|nr:carbon-nitrogen hydrolase family protein [Streptosporangiaceae bacterium]
MPRVTVAAVQAAPEFLDRAATIDKVIALAEEAASRGARLVAFPEAFVPGYPDWVWRTRPWDDTASTLYARLLEQALVAASPACDALAEAARRLGIWLSVGATERDPAGSTLYNALLHFAPDGRLAGRHRKLMPSGGERLVWGAGDGSGLTTIDTGFGRLGGLICWENYMPLARSALYAQGIDIYLAPTWDNSDVWIPTLRHIAREGRTYVIGVTACLRATDLPEDLPGRAALYGGAEDWLSRGNSAIISPAGDIIAGPLAGEEGIVCAEIDAEVARASRQQLDVVGHYSRSDMLRLTVDATARAAVTFRRDDAEPPARPSAGSAAPSREAAPVPGQPASRHAGKR